MKTNKNSFSWEKDRPLQKGLFITVLQILIFLSYAKIIAFILLVWKLRQAPNQCLNAKMCGFAQVI